MIGWLADLASVLRPGGILSLAVPDKRYSFDVRRRCTELSELVDAHLNRRQYPSIGQIFDFHAKKAFSVTTADLWAGDDTYLRLADDDEGALGISRWAYKDPGALEVHCTVFTDASFLDLLQRLFALDLVPAYEVASFHATEPGSVEFHITLRRLPDGIDAAERRARQLASLPAPVEASALLLGDISASEAKIIEMKRRAMAALRRLPGVRATEGWLRPKPVHLGHRARGGAYHRAQRVSAVRREDGMRKTAMFVVGATLAASVAWVAPTLTGSAFAAEPAPPGFHGVAPARLLDTRVGSPTVDGIDSGLGPLAAGATVNVRVAGRGGVPAVGVGAVALNLTATNASAPTFVSVWATGEGRPLASILNPAVGDTRPNAVVVAVGEGGSVTLYNDSGTVDLVADVTGWFDEGAFHGVVPTRLVDTRIGQGAPTGPLGPNATLTMDVAGHTGVPIAGAESVVINVTATESSETSFLTAWPAGEPRPVTSNLNTLTDRSVAGLVVVKIGAAGAVNLYNFLGTTHLVVDVMGWFGPGPITGINPFRLMDTRNGTGGAPLPLFARECVAVQATGRGGVPASGVGAVILSVTATEPSDPSYVTAWPNGIPRPIASNVNTAPGLNASNLVVAPVGTGGRVSLYNYAGSVQLVVDVLGWLPGDTPPGDALPAESNGCLTASAGALELPRRPGRRGRHSVRHLRRCPLRHAGHQGRLGATRSLDRHPDDDRRRRQAYVLLGLGRRQRRRRGCPQREREPDRAHDLAAQHRHALEDHRRRRAVLEPLRGRRWFLGPVRRGGRLASLCHTRPVARRQRHDGLLHQRQRQHSLRDDTCDAGDRRVLPRVGDRSRHRRAAPGLGRPLRP